MLPTISTHVNTCFCPLKTKNGCHSRLAKQVETSGNMLELQMTVSNMILHLVMCALQATHRRREGELLSVQTAQLHSLGAPFEQGGGASARNARASAGPMLHALAGGCMQPPITGRLGGYLAGSRRQH